MEKTVLGARIYNCFNPLTANMLIKDDYIKNRPPNGIMLGKSGVWSSKRKGFIGYAQGENTFGDQSSGVLRITGSVSPFALALATTSA